MCPTGCFGYSQSHDILRFFSKASAIALTSFLQFLAVSGAPIVVPRATQSASLSSLTTPIVTPYYLYFGNPSTAKLADAFDSVSLKAATIGFASATKGQVSERWRGLSLANYYTCLHSAHSRVISTLSLATFRHLSRKVYSTFFSEQIAILSPLAIGGAITISFGGNLQDQTDPRQHVQQACTDVPSLVQLIEGAMSTFGTHNIDFDIEACFSC